MKKTQKDAVEYSVEIPKQNKYFFLIRKFLEDILKGEAITEKELDDIVLAVNEACDKLVRLDASGRKNMKITMRVRVTSRKIVIAVSYRGETKLPNYFKEMDEDAIVLESVRNRIGEYMMEKAADEVNWSASRKKGQIIRITKIRQKKAPGVK